MACHYCGSQDSEFVFPVVLADKTICSFQQNRICRVCGLVCRNPVIPELNKMEYSPSSWGDISLFKENAEITARSIAECFAGKEPPRHVLEIGSGHGLLYESLQQIFPETKFVLCESSRTIAAELAKRYAQATVLPCSVDDLKAGERQFDLIIACGVDYLFPNHLKSMKLIHSMLKDGGHVYFDRNVFVGMRGCVGLKIVSKHDFFSRNNLITVYFHKEMFENYLEIFFTNLNVGYKQYFVSQLENGEILSYFGEKREFPETARRSGCWFQDAVQFIGSLSDVDTIGVRRGDFSSRPGEINSLSKEG